MPSPANINDLCYLGGERHTWISDGLDVVEDVLCSVRHCIRCPKVQTKPYGRGGDGGWRDA